MPRKCCPSPRRVITGSGAPAMTVTGASFFGDIEMGSPHDELWDVMNTGGGILEITGLDFLLPDDNPMISYSLVSPSLPISISAGQTVQITIRFDAEFDYFGFETPNNYAGVASFSTNVGSYIKALNAHLWLLFTNFPNDDASPIANPTALEIGELAVAQLDGTFAIADGKLNFTAQVTPTDEDLAVASESLVGNTAYNLVALTILNQSTRNASCLGWYINQTINTQALAGITTSASGNGSIQTLRNGSVLANPYGLPVANTDIPAAFCFHKDSFNASVFVKLAGVWRFLLRITTAEVALYFGANNSDAVGFYQDVRAVPLDGLFLYRLNPAQNPSAGTTWTDPVNVQRRVTIGTRPSAGVIDIHIREQDPTNFYSVETGSTGLANIYETVAGAKSPSKANGSGIVDSDMLTLSAYGSHLLVHRVPATGAPALVTSYHMDKFLTATEGRLQSLGTGGVVDLMSSDNLFLGTEGAVGANVAANPDFASDTVWTKPTGGTISGGKFHKAAGSAGSLVQSGILTVNNLYEISFTVSNYSAGDVSLFGTGNLITADGTYVFREIVNTADLSLLFSATAAMSIDDFTAKPIPLTQNADGDLLDLMLSY